MFTPKTVDETFDNLSEEIGDVMINIEQMLYLFSDMKIDEKVNEIKEYKVNRWYDRTFSSQK